MVQCTKCWKNLTGKPRCIIVKNKHSYRVCESCLKSKVVQEMLSNCWDVYLETPTLKEMLTVTRKAK